MNIQDVLIANSLEQYNDGFDAAGLTAFDYFLSISSEEVDQILTNVGMLRGHIFKFKKIIDDMRSSAMPKSAPGFSIITEEAHQLISETHTINTDNSLNSLTHHHKITEGDSIIPHVPDPQTELSSCQISNTSDGSTNSNVGHSTNGLACVITNEPPFTGEIVMDNSSLQNTSVIQNVIVKETAIKVIQLQGQLDYILQFKEGILKSLTEFTTFDFSTHIQSLRDLKTMQESINGLLNVEMSA